MSISSSKKRDRRGRPQVDSEAVNVRFIRADLDRLDDWRAKQEDEPTRPEAVRRLVEKGLAK
jgi:hypothetical protein